MAKIKPRVKVPKSVTAGEEFVIKSLISHPMESGRRKDSDGAVIPRKIINTFEATFNGEQVILVNIEPAVSTNPYFQFSMKIEEAGDLHFKWTDDDGSVYETTKSIALS